MNPQVSASQAYRESSVLTASPEQLVVMLYDGAIRFLTRSAHEMRNGRHRESMRPLARAEAIIDELLATLDLERGGEIAQRLQGIYVFSRQQLVEAQLKRDPERIEQVMGLLRSLREAWQEICGS